MVEPFQRPNHKARINRITLVDGRDIFSEELFDNKNGIAQAVTTSKIGYLSEVFQALI